MPASWEATFRLLNVRKPEMAGEIEAIQNRFLQMHIGYPDYENAVRRSAINLLETTRNALTGHAEATEAALNRILQTLD